MSAEVAYLDAAAALDALHLATALSRGNDLAAVVTYDSRMSAAAPALGLTVIAPR